MTEFDLKTCVTYLNRNFDLPSGWEDDFRAHLLSHLHETPPAWTPDLVADEYREAVGLVDGVVEDVRAGHYKDMAAAIRATTDAAAENRYVCDPGPAAVTLWASAWATRGFLEIGASEDWNEGKDPFPWKRLALPAFKSDCLANLYERPEFKDLKHE